MGSKKKPPPHAWKPGQSGNPGGRPKKSRELEELIREALTMPDGRNKAVERLLGIMAEGEDKDSIAAAKLLKAYGYGNPRQQVEVTGEDGGPLEIATTRGLLASAVARLKK